MRQGRGEAVGNAHRVNLFSLWNHILIHIEDYPYAEMIFHGDSNLPLPPGWVWIRRVSDYGIFVMF